MAETREVEVGQVWRSDLGGVPQVVVALDETMVYVLRADYSKRAIARAIERGKLGGGIVSRSEFAAWRFLRSEV